MQGGELGAGSYDTDKLAQNRLYLSYYERRFGHLRDREVRLLELGVLRGGSLLMWRDYFPLGTIMGLDRVDVSVDDPTGRVHVYRGDQQDIELLGRIAEEQAPDGFDIIIDDCSHLAEPTRASFWYLFEHHLRPGGTYVIEDWSTGYVGTWPDGVQFRPRPPRRFDDTKFRRRQKVASLVERAPAPIGQWAKRLTQVGLFQRHDYGLAGFVKELVDEVGWFQLEPWTLSRFDEMVVAPGQIFVVKRA